MWVRFLGWKDPLEEEMATHFIILAWRIPWAEEPGGLQSMGLQKSRTQLKRLSTDTSRQEMNAFASYVWVTKKEKNKNHQTQTKSKQSKVKTNQVMEQTKQNKTKKSRRQEVKF